MNAGTHVPGYGSGAARRRFASLTVAGLGVASLLALAPAAPAAAAGDCRLVELAPPTGGFDAGVMDIEVVDGVATYYGNYQVMEDDGRQHQRAVVWHGLGGAPQQVDPGLGGFEDIAFDLSPSGLVNGETWFEDRPVLSWVHDLRTGTTTVLDTSPGSSTEKALVWARRINSSGELVGARQPGNGAGGMKRPSDALAWDHYTGDPRRLPSNGVATSAMGLNEQGDRSGFVGKQEPGVRGWATYVPTIWHSDGRVTTMDTVGIEAIPYHLADDGTAAGEGASSYDIPTLHYEAMVWPSADQAVGLGVLPGGSYSRAFGIDEGGWAVGAAFQDSDAPEAEDRGEVARSFLYRHGVTTPGTIEVLPTLWSVEHGVEDWQQWFGSAVHAASSPLDQVASASHSGYRENGWPTFGATVYVNASRCGVEVPTTHDPYGIGAAPTDGAGLDAARATAARHDRASGRGH